MRPSILAAALGLSLAAFATRVLANGRYPAAQQLLVDPTNESHLWLRATYGILTSRDTGKTWSWICDSAVGYDPREDPTMAITADGSTYAGVSEGLFVTHDQGCSWPADPSVGEGRVMDLTTSMAASTLLALTVQVEPDGDYSTSVFASTGRSGDTGLLGALGPPIVKDLLSTTIDTAPSDDRRVYVAGAIVSGAVAEAGPDLGALLRSRDGGATWTRRPIEGTGTGTPYIAAVSPTNPDALFVRVRGESDGKDPVQSFLLYSSDAGEHFKEVFRGSADLLGFALSSDGGTVSVGLGDTHDAIRPVDAAALGLYRASVVDFQFERVFTGQVGCLTESANGLYVCGEYATTGFELGISKDRGATVTPLLGHGGVSGPLECPAMSAEALRCAPFWSDNCAALGSCPASVKPSPPTKAQSGCSCSSPGRKQQGATDELRSTPARWAQGVLSLLALGIVRRRKRRAAQS